MGNKYKRKSGLYCVIINLDNHEYKISKLNGWHELDNDNYKWSPDNGRYVISEWKWCKSAAQARRLLHPTIKKYDATVAVREFTEKRDNRKLLGVNKFITYFDILETKSSSLLVGGGNR